jgi:hypothetical protein
MAYSLRILGKVNPVITVNDIHEKLAGENLQADFHIQRGTTDNWTQIIFRSVKGTDLVLIEKTDIEPGARGEEQMQAFKDAVYGDKPTNASEWLVNYFDQIKVIYTLEMLSPEITEENYWDIVTELKMLFWDNTLGIFQGDHEGFSNEDGFLILWHFDENAQGSRYVGTLDENGEWVNYEIDLANEQQREQFLAGKLPENLERL